MEEEGARTGRGGIPKALSWERLWGKVHSWVCQRYGPNAVKKQTYYEKQIIQRKNIYSGGTNFRSWNCHGGKAVDQSDLRVTPMGT